MYSDQASVLGHYLPGPISQPLAADPTCSSAALAVAQRNRHTVSRPLDRGPRIGSRRASNHGTGDEHVELDLRELSATQYRGGRAA